MILESQQSWTSNDEKHGLMRTRSFPFLFAMLTAVIMIYGLWQYDQFKESQFQHELRNTATGELNSLTNRLMWQMNWRTNIARTVAAFASVNPDLTEDDFLALYANLTENRREESKIWVALIKDQQVAFGSLAQGSLLLEFDNIDEIEGMADAINFAKETDNPAFFGPVRDRQGNMHMAVFVPIYESRPGSADHGKYIGVAAVEYQLRALFRRAGIIQQDSQLWLSVMQATPGNLRTSLYGDEYIIEQGAVLDSLDLDDRTRWDLAAIPAGGWSRMAPGRARLWMVGLALTLAMSLLAWFLSRIPTQLSKAVRDATAALRDSEERFRSLFEATFEAVFVHDSGTILDVNQAFERLLGYSHTELIGTKGPMYVHERYRAIVAKKIALHDESPYEVTMVRKDGTTFDAEVVGKDHIYRGRQVRVVAIHDITERKRAEELLHQRVEFETLLNSISAHFINAGPESFNEGMERSLETLGKHLGSDSSYLVRFVEKLLRHDEVYEWTASGTEAPLGAVSEFSLEHMPWLLGMMKSGQVVRFSHLEELPEEAIAESKFFKSRSAVSFVAMPLQSEGATIGMLGFESRNSDVVWTEAQVAQLRVVSEMFASAIVRKGTDEALRETMAELDAANRMLQQHSATLKTRVEERTIELAREREKALEASRAKSEFLSTMSHELRTPLNSILGLAQVIMMKIGSTIPEQQKENLAAIVTSGRRLLDLINQLLDLSRIEEGRTDIRITEFAIDDPVKEAFESVRPLAERKGLEYEMINYASGLPMQSDRDKLIQILINLLGNAVKFTDQGKIELSVQPDEGQFTFIVHDTGIGIPQDQRDLVFEQFRQGDSSSTRRHGGSGLGLAISKKLSQMLGGDLTLEDAEIGSTFCLRLPARAPSEVPSVAMEV